MTDTGPSAIGDAPTEPIRRPLWKRLSAVWIVPFAAVAIALSVAYQNYADQGPLITIAFEDASGVTADETQLRYRDVSVGRVEGVAFSDGLDKVLVSVRLKDASLAPFVDAGSKFWVVRPEVTTRGVSGLDTVLSGVFIEGVWDTAAGGFQADHVGSVSEPLLGVGEDGLLFRLRAGDGASLVANTPILFKGIEVGRLGTPELTPLGSAAETDAVIYAPYDDLITSRTRFWDISGFSFTLGAEGAALDFSSIATLLSGGVTFETLVSGGVPVRDGVVFELYADEETARTSLIAEGSGPTVNVAVIFDENVSGLTRGATVELRGVPVGEVQNVTGLIDAERFGDQNVRLLATLAIRPNRMGLDGDDTEDDAIDFLATRVRQGLRARLATASLITGGLKIELIDAEGAPFARLERDAEPFPLLPSIESDVADVSNSAQGVLERVANLPIEELIQSAVVFLNTATELVGDEELGRVPGEVTGLLADVRGVVGSEQIQELPDQVGAVLADLQEAVADVQAIVSDEAFEALPGELAGLVEDARGMIGSDEAQALPARIEAAIANLETTSDALRGLLEDEDIAALPGQLTALVGDVRGVTSAEAFQALPTTVAALAGELETTAAELRAILDDPALDTLPGDVSGLVAEARGLVGSEAAQALPEQLQGIMTQIDGASTRLNALLADEAFEALPGQVSAVLEDVEGVTGSDAVQGLPEQVSILLTDLSTAARDFDALATELVEAKAAERLLAAVDGVSEAADGVFTSVEGIPELVETLNAVAETANTLPLQQVATDLSATLVAAREIMASDAAKALPGSLNGALDEVEDALAALREGGTVQNMNRTLASAADAAGAIEAAAERLPQLVARLEGLAAQANGTLAGYDTNSEFGRSARAALREVQGAAKAAASLAKALERRPNSIILGR
ncbi:MAG: MlaD family protein [Pseudomonadota bacterium]